MAFLKIIISHPYLVYEYPLIKRLLWQGLHGKAAVAIPRAVNHYLPFSISIQKPSCQLFLAPLNFAPFLNMLDMLVICA